MDLTEIKQMLTMPEYDFLRTEPNLGDNIILLGLGGSHAYGLDTPDSDLDIRGIATRRKNDILIGNDFAQYVETETDTTIYSFDKIIKLFCSCNPNTIEMGGLRPEHYLYISPVGQEILDNMHLFLSKRAIHSFGGYANSQLHRLSNKAVRKVSQSEMETHILKTINHAGFEFHQKYFDYSDDEIKLYLDTAVQEGYDTEIFMDINLHHYPLRDYKSMWAEMNNIVKGYSKVGTRNEKAIAHNKLGKHMCHLVRLYLMCFDILEKGEINTYREKDHDFLMSLRNGDYLDDNDQPTPEFYDIVAELENKMDYWSKHTNLPDNVDMDKVNDLVARVNEDVFYCHKWLL